MIGRWMGVAWVCGCFTAAVSAGPTVSVFEDTANTIPGVVANTIQADGDGTDWTGIVLRLDLTAGTVYNAPQFDGALPQDGFWGILPALEWDSWLGVPGDGSNGVIGGAGDFGAPQSFLQTGLTGTGGQAISAAIFNTDLTDTGVYRIGNISLSDDATGTFQLGVSFAGGFMRRYITAGIENGHMNLSPTLGDLERDGFVGIKDLNTILGSWNQTVPPADPLADPSGDGFIGIDDLGHVLGSWNLGTPGPAHDPIDPGPLPGDTDLDGFVGIADLKPSQNNWNFAVTPGEPRLDWSGDGFIGMDDFNVVLTHWNTGTPPAPAVPEPGTLSLLTTACLFGIARERRSC